MVEEVAGIYWHRVPAKLTGNADETMIDIHHRFRSASLILGEKPSKTDQFGHVKLTVIMLFKTSY